MALEAHLQQATLLKKVVDAMKDLCKKVNIAGVTASAKHLQQAVLLKRAVSAMQGQSKEEVLTNWLQRPVAQLGPDPSG